MWVPVRVRVCIGLRICLEDGGVSWSIDCLGLMLIWLRFRRTWPLGVSMWYDLGVSAAERVLPAVAC